jgi:hypothetical protein
MCPGAGTLVCHSMTGVAYLGRLSAKLRHLCIDTFGAAVDEVVRFLKEHVL